MKRIALILCTMLTFVSSGHSCEQKFQLKLEKVFTNGGFMREKQISDVDEYYIYSTDTTFEELRKNLIALLGDGWKDISETDPKEAKKMIKLISPKHLEMEVWLHQEKSPFADKKFSTTVSLFRNVPQLDFVTPKAK